MIWFKAALMAALLLAGVVLMVTALVPATRPRGINRYWRRVTPFTEVPQERLGAVSATSYMVLGLALTCTGGFGIGHFLADWNDTPLAISAAATIVIFLWRVQADSSAGK